MRLLILGTTQQALTQTAQNHINKDAKWHVTSSFKSCPQKWGVLPHVSNVHMVTKQYKLPNDIKYLVVDQVRNKYFSDSNSPQFQLLQQCPNLIVASSVIPHKSIKFDRVMLCATNSCAKLCSFFSHAHSLVQSQVDFAQFEKCVAELDERGVCEITSDQTDMVVEKELGNDKQELTMFFSPISKNLTSQLDKMFNEGFMKQFIYSFHTEENKDEVVVYVVVEGKRFDLFCALAMNIISALKTQNAIYTGKLCVQ
jgi:hypothetical protein